MSTLGVIVPCRNEAAVIERKLANLAASRWPASSRPHRVIVVDDGSDDDTAAHASAALARHDDAGVRFELVANRHGAGKGRAIVTALELLGESVDLIVLTDADVVCEPEALVELARAFDDDPRLGMASGGQRFVEDLASDGSARARSGAKLVARDTFYDWFATRVRAIESLRGLLFSVQGQLMAWRRELALVPLEHMAADDLDLMLQVRLKNHAIARVASARFYEVRPGTPDERARQAVRRARAYHQFLRHPRIEELAQHGGWLARAQVALYRGAGRGRAGWSIVPLALTFVAGWYFGPAAAIGATATWIVLLGPAWIVALQVRQRMHIASALEARGSMGERWDTPRR